jgi:hypothetical protein
MMFRELNWIPFMENEMKELTKKILAITGLLVLGLTSVEAQNEDPVLDLMVRKGLVSQADADQARAEEKQQEENKPASVITLQDKSIQNLEFYGDGRLRYENIDQHNHYSAVTLYNRERYRLRFGLNYIYSDHLKAGFELESGTTDDSANQTLGATFTKSSMNVGKIFLQYQPVDELTLIAGKFTNPWYTTTDMVYSFDLNPEGGAELFNYTIPLDGISPVVSDHDAKDVKEISTKSSSSDSSLSIGLNAVQYLYVDNNESTGTPGLNNNDVLIIGNQIPVTWKINKDTFVKVAPGFTFYTGGGNTDYDGGVATNTGSTITGTTAGTPGTYFATANSAVDPVFYSPREADDLAIFSAPGEVDFKVAGIPFRPYWDFELNTEGKKRVQDVYLQHTGFLAGYGTGVTPATAAQNKALGDNIAWSAGLQVGANKKKGDWSGLAEFRQIGLGAVDQNINGTDYADSYANQQGIKVASAYNFTDFLTLTATFYDTWDYKDNLYKSLGGTAATPSSLTGSTLNLVGEKSDQRLQVDLGWKF